MVRNGLQTRQVQRHGLTPDLIKSFQLFDLPFLALGNFVGQMTADNPFLEFDYSMMESSEGLFAADEMPDYMEPYEGMPRTGPDPRTLMACADATDTLRSELRLHLFLQHAPAETEQAGLAIIEEIDARGYFTGALDQLARRLRVREAACEDALSRIQSFVPAGVGARNLRECLWLQARDHPDAALLERILNDPTDRLEKRDLAYFAKLCGVSRARIAGLFSYLATLKAAPAADDRADQTQYVYPDLAVHCCADELEVSVSDGERFIRLDRAYYETVRGVPELDGDARSFIREQYGAAREWVRLLHIRQTSLVLFARHLATLQGAYFREGPRALQPLNMRQMAEQMQVHPSTVCRLVKDKYIQTDWGTVPVSSLFTGAYYADDTLVAASAVKSGIRALFAHEDPAHPLSDEQAAAAVRETMQITLSRRTVAKYRAELGIPCRNARKIAAQGKEGGR